MKLALVYPDLSHKGGAENVVVWTAMGLCQRGHAVTVLTGACRPELWPDYPGLADCVEEVAVSGRKERGARALETGRALAPRLAEFPVVYAHNRYGLLWSLAAPQRLFWYCQEPSRRLYAPFTDEFLLQALERTDVEAGHPALANMRVLLRKLRRNPKRVFKTWRHRRRERQWVARPERCFVNSRFSATTFEAAFERRPAVLDLGVPLASAPTAEGEREGIVVVTSGSPKKNLYGVLAAAAELERRGSLPGERFEVWGVGTDAEEFQELLARWKLGARVRLHGYVDDGWARERLARARLCLFLPLCEPFGLVAVEALAAGVPVVASDHGGPAEILERCGGGRTVDPLRPDRVADVLEEVLGGGADRGVPSGESAAAAQRAREIFSMNAYLERTEGLLAGAGELVAAAEPARA